MKKIPDKRLLFVAQDIAPYLPSDRITDLGRAIPQAMQQSKEFEVRTFMPRFGAINERRNQLHEVIRLSGLNIEINNNDHPLIIKVASMLPVRIQVYFIDNDDYFTREESDADAHGSNRSDNDERAIYFARGTMETVKKLRWEPGVVHCQGWMTALTPVYMQRNNETDPESPYRTAKYVYTVSPDDAAMTPVDPAIFDKLADDGIVTPEEVSEALKSNKESGKEGGKAADLLHRLAIMHSDAVVFLTETPDPALLELANGRGMKVLTLADGADSTDAYRALYDSLLEK